MHICMYDYMYVLFCHVLYGCFVCILYIVCIYMYVFMYIYICLCISGIYPSNFDFHLTAQKLNLHKILEHVSIEILSKILFFTRFLLSWAIYLSFRSKKAKIFQELYPLNPHQGSTLNRLQSLQHLETFSCILQHLKTQSYFKKRTVVELLG